MDQFYYLVGVNGIVFTNCNMDHGEASFVSNINGGSLCDRCSF